MKVRYTDNTVINSRIDCQVAREVGPVQNHVLPVVTNQKQKHILLLLKHICIWQSTQTVASSCHIHKNN